MTVADPAKHSGAPPTASEPRPPLLGIIRRKGNIGPLGLFLLVAAGCLPLLLGLARVLASPGAPSLPIAGVDALVVVGDLLNESFSLDWVPPADRPDILYLLLLPMGALLIAFTRMTLGLRVLGIRAILIAIGFQESGVLPSLILMAMVIAAIVAIRPTMRRIRLPMYGRISVIVCLAGMLMVTALLLGPLLRSETVWSVAFFPVIIVAMVADGFARTVANENMLTAIWRAAWTVVVALVIAGVSQLSAVRSFALTCPELMLTHVVLIVLIAEFLDARLLEKWPARLSRFLDGVSPWMHERPKVAVVRNRWSSGVIGRLGRPATAKYRKHSVQLLVDALRDQGLHVRVFEGDVTLLRKLQDFLRPDPRTGSPGGLVLNLATGVQGRGQFSHVSAMLEMAGLPYTGPDPIAHARQIDHYALLTALAQGGVRVPRFVQMSSATHSVGGLQFPLWVRPRFEPDVGRVVVKDRESLERRVGEILSAYSGPAVVEEAVGGRDIRVPLLGNETIECLPLLERRGRGEKVVPAPLDDGLADRIRRSAYDAYIAAGCRDYARVDFRAPSRGAEPVVVGVRWAGVLVRAGSFVRSAEAAGYTLPSLMHRIVHEASLRYGTSATSARWQAPLERSVVPFEAKQIASK